MEVGGLTRIINHLRNKAIASDAKYDDADRRFNHDTSKDFIQKLITEGGKHHPGLKFKHNQLKHWESFLKVASPRV